MLILASVFFLNLRMNGGGGGGGFFFGFTFFFFSPNLPIFFLRLVTVHKLTLCVWSCNQ